MENENRISDLIDGGIQKENELFKGTKGEWKRVKLEKTSTYLERNEIHYGQDGECVAEFIANDFDALIISKAPEILEKLQESTEVIKWYMENSTSELPETFFNIGANQIEQNEQLIKQATEL